VGFAFRSKTIFRGEAGPGRRFLSVAEGAMSVEDRLAWCQTNLPKFRLKSDGRSGEACCELPGHDDNRPSLFIGLEASAGYYKCQGCAGKGTLVDYAEVTGKPAFPVTEAAGGPPPTSWTYIDRDRNPLLRVTRRELEGRKSFFQERWEGGAWLKGGLSTQPLLYAPELAAAPAGSLCFLVEGEKCAQHLNERGLLATTAPMGAGKFDQVGRDWLELLLPLGVVILPDNDEPGLKHARQVAERLQRELDIEAKILLLPGLGPKEDVADWLVVPRTKSDLLALVPKALSLEEFQQSLVREPVAIGPQPADPSKPDVGQPKATEREEEDWGPVQPLDPAEVESTPFPKRVLGDGFLRRYVKALAEFAEVPVEICALGTVVATLAAVSKKIRIQSGQGRTLQLTGQALIFYPSGLGKSTLFNELLAPFADIQRERRDDVARFNQERRGLEEELKAAKPGTDAARTLTQQLFELGPEKLTPLLLVKNPTAEALVSVLKDNNGFIFVANDESTEYIEGLGGSHRDGLANFDLILAGKYGDFYSRHTRGFGSEIVEKPNINMLLMAQDDLPAKIRNKPGFKKRGVLARMMLLWPPSPTTVQKSPWDRKAMPEELKKQWSRLIRAIFAVSTPSDSDGEPIPHVIELSNEAIELCREFGNWARSESLAGGSFDSIRESAARFEEHALTTAAALHLAETLATEDWSGRNHTNPWEQPISGECMQRAIEFVKFTIPSVMEVHHPVGSPLTSNSGSGRIWQAVQSLSKKMVRTREVHRKVAHHPQFRTSASVCSALQELEHLGYVRRVDDSKHSPKGGRPSDSWLVNPNIPKSPDKLTKSERLRNQAVLDVREHANNTGFVSDNTPENTRSRPSRKELMLENGRKLEAAQ